jgi:hypothetical protein
MRMNNVHVLVHRGDLATWSTQTHAHVLARSLSQIVV